MQGLYETARALVAADKGVLAADEPAEALGQRFASVGAACTAEARRSWRELLFTAPGMGKFISGAVLSPEALHQQGGGAAFPELLASRGIMAGVRVDKGARPFSKEESLTEGLEGLEGRLERYGELGARFCAWRAVFPAGPNRPSEYGLQANAQRLGRYAALCQKAGLVPIVVAEVLMDGPQPIEQSAAVTARVLQGVLGQLGEHNVDLGASLLAPNMVVSGYAAAQRAGVEQVAEATLEVLYRHVPPALAGIVFVSGGQPDDEATANLAAMNAKGPHPWPLSFLFGRALDGSALRAWAGQAPNVPAAQEAFYHRAMAASAARAGKHLAQAGLQAA